MAEYGPNQAPLSYLFRIIGMKQKNKADKSISEMGLNAQQGRTIGFIDDHEGMIQKDLSHYFGCTDASTTSILQGLEKKGYIERRILKDNEREKRLYVLPKGKALITAFSEKFMENERELGASLTDDEKETLIALLIKINNSL